MSKEDRLVDFSSINEMLYGEKNFISEFSTAAVSSFTEFRENYQKYLLARDEENFRKAGHKIKPVALMLGVEQIVEEYEYGKTLIWEEKPDEELEASALKIKDLSTRIIQELEESI